MRHANLSSVAGIAAVFALGACMVGPDYTPPAIETRPSYVETPPEGAAAAPDDGLWWRAVTGRLYPEVSQGMTYETHNIDGFMRHADFPSVADAMLRHGYDEATVRQILGGNWRRVYGQVWDRPSGPAGSDKGTIE